MQVTYEAKINVHVPDLKCSYQKGTRFLLQGEKIIVGDREAPLSNDFKILIKCGSLKELSEKEAMKPEKVSAPKTIKIPERKSLKVVMAQDLSKPLVAETQEEEKRVIEAMDSNSPEEKSIRGMKIVKENSSEIKTMEERTPKKEISPEKAAKVEATRQARLAALEKARAAATAKREAEKAEKAQSTSETQEGE